jgi:hypothetical protein
VSPAPEPSAAAWLELVDLAERQLALGRDGRWEDAAACADERARRSALLGSPPAQARPALERLAAVHDALVALMATARVATLRELQALRTRSGAAHGYARAATTGVAAGRIDGRA